MAKQLVNPIERHVEKAAVGIAGLVLIGVIARFVVSSPNQSELGGGYVTPSTVDKKVFQKAASVRDAIRRAPVSIEQPEPLFETFVAQLDPMKVAGLPLTLSAAVPIGPEVPVIDPPKHRVGNSPLVKVQKADQPTVTSGRSTFSLTNQAGEERRLVTNWVTVSAVVDVKAQMAAQSITYGATRKDVVFGPNELQRRERRPDGSWSDDDWKTVEVWEVLTTRLPRPLVIRLEQDEEGIGVSKDVQGDIDRFYSQLKEPKRQLDLLRPLIPYEIANGDEWAFPVITKYRDVLMQDDQYLYPSEPPSTDPLDRYRSEEERPVRETETVSRKDQIDGILTRLEQRIQDALKELNENEAIRVYNDALTLEKDKDASPTQRSRATRIKNAADQAIATIRRNKFKREGQQPVQKADDVKVGPGPRTREPYPIQQIWVHDARPGSVRGGKVYQYRIRTTLFNRLAGEPEKFADPDNATVVWIPGPWSEPVEVIVQSSSQFFVTLASKKEEQVKIELFQWFEGEWCKTREGYSVGQKLSRNERQKVKPLDATRAYDLANVDYAADGTIVDIDFDRTYRDRKRGATRSGVKFGPGDTACSVVVMDSEGHLHERFVETDKKHPAKTALSKIVWKPTRRD